MATELWILESLPENERQTGTLLQHAVLGRVSPLKKSIKVEHRNIDSRQEFFEALDQVLHSSVAGNFPILHIEAHGNEEGLGLKNGDFIGWGDLSEPLVQINDQLKAIFVVTVAACWGGHMAKTALHSIRAPFFAVIGPDTSLYDSELIKDYTEFYFEYDKTRSITKARWALNCYKSYSGDYYFTTATNIFTQAYEAKWLENLTPEQSTYRINDLTKRLLKSDPSLNVSDVAMVAEKVITNPKKHVRDLWDKFLFIDKYPGNGDLFPFPFP